MKTPLGTEVDLDPGHIVLNGSKLCAKGAQQPPIFSAYVYCGLGRPTQLLLSSCTNGCPKTFGGQLRRTRCGEKAQGEHRPMLLTALDQSTVDATLVQREVIFYLLTCIHI